ncbi:MAG: hypothetical protein DMG13_10395 [Acidobacteria bacterium]|nr:MAG: hypothetical protein DMG13_10395 [Acidobacteriota bacterium]
MKKTIAFAALGISVFVVAVIFKRGVSAKWMLAAHAVSQVSPKSAESLQVKIDTLKKANKNPDRRRGASRMELSEAELESYVFYSLKDDIPAQLDSVDVQLGPGTVASDTQLTFMSDSTGNPIVDSLIGGTHNLFLKGKLVGEQGRGKFDLDEIRVDGIPVPKILIQTLFDKYVKPDYPEADLKEPFDLPYGIQQLKLEPGKATVVY